MPPTGEGAPAFDADVVVIGSGFGGSAAALRFAEAGHRVVVLERGDEVVWSAFRPDLDMFWSPRRQRFGMNNLKRRGRHVVTWTGAAVGGGSHVYAATLKRRIDFTGFPSAIRADDLTPYYDRAEDMLGATEYPHYPPYSDVASTELLLEADRRLSLDRPDLVEEAGRLRLGISFAPEGGHPGARFTNRFGVEQRYADPRDQSILGGDIGSKNSLDRNYHVVAREHGARIDHLCQVDTLRRLPGGGWEVGYRRLERAQGLWSRLRRRFALHPAPPLSRSERIITRVVVVSAGVLGSTELLLRNRDQYATLPELNAHLGTRYSTNGDTLTLLLPRKGLALGWGGLALLVASLVVGNVVLAVIGAVVHVIGVLQARRAYDPDLGPTNSDYIRFRASDGSRQGVYIEGGRYPNPGRWAIAAALGAIGGYRPTRYRSIAQATNFLRRWIPPLGLVSRTLPVPLLTMGRDRAVGRVVLAGDDNVSIDIDLDENQPYYAYTDSLGRLVAGAARAWWLPNPVLRWLKIVEVPHNLGGVPMGETAADGVVDHLGRVFGVDDLVVLDGSIIPVAMGPNPALTILALAERALPHLLDQLATEGHIRASG
jgi:cholesterol oxidase